MIKCSELLKFVLGCSLFLTLSAGLEGNASAESGGGGSLTYEVPRSDLLDEPLFVDLKKAKFRFRGDGAFLDYRLPKELDGANPKRFFLNNATFDGEVWKLRTDEVSNTAGDPAASATCRGTERDFTCEMVYGKSDAGVFLLDSAASDAYLDSRTDLTPAQVAHVKTAREALSHEPIGIIRSKR